MANRRAILLSGGAALLMAGCSGYFPEDSERRADLVGVWKCIDGNENADPALENAVLALAASGRFSWAARSETSEFPVALTGRWGFSPQSNQLWLAETRRSSKLAGRRMAYNLGANVSKTDNPERLTLAFTYFSDYWRKEPITLIFERVQQP